MGREDKRLSTRELAVGALVSLCLSVAVYAVLAGLMGWIYLAGLPDDLDAFGGEGWTLLKRFTVVLALFLPAICLWWLVIFLVGQHRIVAEQPAPTHRRVAAADLWLLLSASVYLLWAYAVATGRLPREGYDCSRDGFIADCVGTKRTYFWGGPAVAAALLLFGLRQRVKGTERRAATDDPVHRPGD